MKRDKVFWMVSLQVSVAGIFTGGFGPAIPLLRDEQGTSQMVAGLHGTVEGFAAILAGVLNSALVAKFGRDRTMWVGLFSTAFGAIIFILGPSIFYTLPAAFIFGFGISVAVNNLLGSLSVHYKKDANQAVSQSAAIVALSAIFGTLIVGLFKYWDLNWRLGLAVIFPLLAILWIFRVKDFGQGEFSEVPMKQTGRLPSRYWISWVGFTSYYIVEFGITYWIALLFRDRVNASPALSTICVIAFGLGMVIGRWFFPPLFNRFHIDRQLYLSISIQLSGFLVLWFSHRLWLSVAALITTGLGMSIQYSAIQVRMLAFSDGKPDLAVGANSYAGGLAIAFGPLFLGYMGDQVGISRANLYLLPFIALTLLSIFLTRNSSQYHIKI